MSWNTKDRVRYVGFPREIYNGDGTGSVTFRIPRSVGPGRKLHHNFVAHTTTTPCGVRGFRAWTASRVLPGFKKCPCGWSGLPHYSCDGGKVYTQKQIDAAIAKQEKRFAAERVRERVRNFDPADFAA